MSMATGKKSQAYPNQTSSHPLLVSRVEHLPAAADGREGREEVKEEDSKNRKATSEMFPF